MLREALTDRGNDHILALSVGFELDIVEQPTAGQFVIAEMMHLDGAGAAGGADGGFLHAIGEIGRQRTDFDRLQTQLAAVERRLEAGGLSAGERVGLDVERAELRAERAQADERIRAMFAALIGMTAGEPDPEVQRQAREHMLALVQRRLIEGDPFRAKTTIEWLLEGASKRNPLGFDAQERGWLEAALVQADAAVRDWQAQLRDRLADQARSAAGATP